jgi:predicted TIM-barrel fold metal-dependent hydrolase
MPTYFPFDPDPRPPAVMPPPGSCDAQFHVFGPPQRYPVRPGAAYEMPTATIDRALAMHRTLGIARGVIVQATTYGADHQVVLDALAVAGPDYRACANAAVLSEKDDAYVEKLHAAGVRGARFSRQSLGIALSDAALQRAFARLRELGWYAKVQPEAGGIIENIAPFEALEIPVLLDHMGRPDPGRGMADPSLGKVIELLGRGNFWVMLSLPEKISRAGAPWDDVLPIARALVSAAPDRCVWASDWPHPVSVRQPPNEGALMDLLFRMVPDADARHRVLVDNPVKLFGFGS